MVEYAEDMRWTVNMLKRRWSNGEFSWSHYESKWIRALIEGDFTLVKIDYKAILAENAKFKHTHKLEEDIMRRWHILMYVEQKLGLRYKYGK